MTWQQTSPSTPWDKDRSRWMSQLPDSLPIQDLSIPGTHDSGALLGFTHFNVSVTQNLKIDEQLSKGIRFLDLRVKIMFSQRGLAMYHGADALYDSDNPHSYDQLYYKAVIGKCVKFLKDNPNETIIVSVKCEGDTSYDGWSVEDWFRQIANEVAADNPPGTWDRWWEYPSHVNATLKDVRGKMLFWRRFPRGGKDKTIDYSQPFGLDLTPMNDKYDNTTGGNWYTPNGGYSYVQDHYTKTTIAQKFDAWYDTLIEAHDSRRVPDHQNRNRQFINFSSIGAGSNPSDYSDVMNPVLQSLLSAMLTGKDKRRHNLQAHPVRSGFGVIPMDYPTQSNIDLLIRSNFEWTYPIAETTDGKNYIGRLKTSLINK